MPKKVGTVSNFFFYPATWNFLLNEVNRGIPSKAWPTILVTENENPYIFKHCMVGIKIPRDGVLVNRTLY